MARGNIDYDQIQSAVRQGNGSKFQMFGGGSVTTGAPLLYDANGNAISGAVTQLVPTPPADATQFLNGSNPPAWSVPAGGGAGAGLVLLGTQTASTSATLPFTSLISSTYDEYELHIIGLVPSTDNDSFGLQVSTDNGSNWVTSGYLWILVAERFALQAGPFGSGSDTEMFFQNSQDKDLGWSYSGVIKLYDPNSTTNKKLFTCSGIGQGNDGNTFTYTGGSTYPQTTAYTAIRIKAGSGNLASGVARLYGISH